MAPGFDAPLRARVGFALGWGALMWALVILCSLLLLAIGGVSRAGVPFDLDSVTSLGGLTGVLGLISFPMFYLLRPWHRHRIGCYAAALVAVAPSALPLSRVASLESLFGTRAISLFIVVLLFTAILGSAQWLSDRGKVGGT